MNIKKLIGKKVMNVVFGEGTVVKASAHYFSVDFGLEVKTFSIECFDKYFLLDDPETIAIVKKITCSIKAKRLRKAAEIILQKKAEIARKEAEKEREEAEEKAKKRKKQANKSAKTVKKARKAA